MGFRGKIRGELIGIVEFLDDSRDTLGYRFVVNGRTGEIQGERPWSAWKVALAGLAGLASLAIIAPIVYFIVQTQG